MSVETGPAESAGSTGKAVKFALRPTRISSVFALVAAGSAAGLLTGTILQRRLLTVALVGVIAVGIGGRFHADTGRPSGIVLGAAGTLFVAVAVAAAMVVPQQLGDRLTLLPGLLGVWVLVMALVPIRAGWSRRLVTLGTGLLFIGILTTGVLRAASPPTLVVAAAATFLAWDAADNAVSLGQQVGANSATATARAELTHLGVSSAVGVGAVAVVVGIAWLGVDGLPFAALLALVIAGLLLALGTHE